MWLTAFFAAVGAPVFVGTGASVGLPVLAATLVLAAGLIALSVIDIETLRLPDALTLSLVVLGLVLASVFNWQPPLIWRLAGALGGFAFLWAFAAGYEVLRGRTGLGLGDAKLLAAAGAWTGPEGIPATLLYACAGALVFAGLRAMRGKALRRDEPFPFGPFLAAGFWLVWCYGPLL